MFTRLNVHLQLNVKASVSVVENTRPPIVATYLPTYPLRHPPFSPSFRTPISPIYVLYADNLLLMVFLFMLHGEWSSDEVPAGLSPGENVM